MQMALSKIILPTDYHIKPTFRQKINRLRLALITLSFMFLMEILASVFSHSLSLLADAGHIAADTIALAITLIATWWTEKSSKNFDKISS